MSLQPIPLTLDGARLGWDVLGPSLGRPLRLDVAPAAWSRVRAARAIVDRRLQEGRPIYGVNTGFGKLCNVRIDDDHLDQLQRNLVLSHAVGVGPAMPSELVRWMLLFKIHALLAGASGATPACIEALIALANADLLPVVPTRGSLGASGDLAPLAHLVLPLIGEGQLLHEGRAVPAVEGLRTRGLAPVRLGPKDGLALLNGTQFMSAYAAAAVVRARRLARHADIVAVMSLEALRGSLRPFTAGLLALRPHPGAAEVGDNVRRMMADSQILASHADCGKVQDPYSLRCVPQVHGACRDALRHVTAVVETEINSVTDNPVLVGEDIISGGNFHGEPLALALDYLALALTEWAGISERRTYLLLSGHDGLPVLLMRESGLNSGFMMPQYTAAALVNECKVLSAPASVDSITTSLGQEDHVSMGATSAVKCWEILDRVETVLAIELLCAAQALDYRLPVQPGRGPRAALAAVRMQIDHAEEDRLLARDIQQALEIVRGGGVVAAVEQAVGPLS